jgi:copper ion binding protein
MDKETFSIPNISCGHCVKTIETELGDLEGVFRVKGDAAKKEVTVEWDSPATLEEIKSTLKEVNYPVSGSG